MYYFPNIQCLMDPCNQKVPMEMRWGYWTQMKAEEALSHLKNVVFPGLVESRRGRMGEGERQVDGLFESLLSQVFAN
jgi:hypothetical protein